MGTRHALMLAVLCGCAGSDADPSTPSADAGRDARPVRACRTDADCAPGLVCAEVGTGEFIGRDCVVPEEETDGGNDGANQQPDAGNDGALGVLDATFMDDAAAPCIGDCPCDPHTRVSTGLASSRFARIATGDGELGVVYQNETSGTYQVHFRRISPRGVLLGDEAVLSDTSAPAVRANIAWSGTEYAAVWLEDPYVDGRVMFRRVSAEGIAVGSPVVVTERGGLYAGTNHESPSIAFTGDGFAIGVVDAGASGDALLVEVDRMGAVREEHTIAASTGAALPHTSLTVRGDRLLFVTATRSDGETRMSSFDMPLDSLGPVAGRDATAPTEDAQYYGTAVPTPSGYVLASTLLSESDSFVHIRALDPDGAGLGPVVELGPGVDEVRELPELAATADRIGLLVHAPITFTEMTADGEVVSLERHIDGIDGFRPDLAAIDGAFAAVWNEGEHICFAPLD